LQTAGRALHKPKWIDPGLSHNKRNKEKRKPAAAHQTHEGEERHEIPAVEEDNQEEKSGSSEDGLGSPDGDDFPEDTQTLAREKIQILDLHTDNPLVLRDGHLFSCQWAANIGTELLFTEHNPNNEIPVLRNLPGDVDLLAASSLRLTSKHLHVEKKAHAEVGGAKQIRSHQSYDPRIRIPISSSTGESRKSQARFLEQVMMVKKARGEEDQVSVVVQQRLPNRGWTAELNAKRQKDRSQLQKTIQRSRDPAVAQKAKEMLLQMDKDDEKNAEALSAAKAKDGQSLPSGRTQKRRQEYPPELSSTKRIKFTRELATKEVGTPGTTGEVEAPGTIPQAEIVSTIHGQDGENTDGKEERQKVKDEMYDSEQDQDLYGGDDPENEDTGEEDENTYG
jgi:hypothetical protein